MVSAKKLFSKLVSYIRFKDLAKSIKMIALSQLNSLKGKISTRGIPLSAIVPFFNREFFNKEYQSTLVTPIGVDKSCCGPHNTNVFKKAEGLIDKLEDSNKTVSIFTVGNRTKDYFKKYYLPLLFKHVYNVDKEPLSLTTSFVFTEKLLEKHFDRYFFVFNRYYTPFQQKTTIYELTGISDFFSISLNTKHLRPETSSEDFFTFIYQLDRDSVDNILTELYFHSVSMVVLDALEENEYSSLGARVTAMDNSTNNATKMIDVLRLQYNKARQASITNELIEIVSAANFV